MPELLTEIGVAGSVGFGYLPEFKASGCDFVADVFVFQWLKPLLSFRYGNKKLDV